MFLIVTNWEALPDLMSSRYPMMLIHILSSALLFSSSRVFYILRHNHCEGSTYLPVFRLQ